mgnify:CR=1 FL=1
MSGILEQAIEFLQNQSKSMQTMIGSGGDTGSSGGIGSVLSQTPMGGGMDTAPTTQPSTMEIPTPSVTTPPPVTATLPVTTPPVNPSTPAPTPTPSVTAPTLGSSLGGLNPNPIPTGQGQNQFGSMTGNFNDPNKINAQPNQSPMNMDSIMGLYNSAMQDRFGGQQSNPQQNIFAQGQSIGPNNPVGYRNPQNFSFMQQPQVLGGSQFAGLGAYQGADQAQLQQLMQQRQQMGGMQQMGNMNPRFGGIAQQFGQNQAIPAQAIPAQMSPNNFVRGPRPQVQLPSGATDQQKNMLMQQYQQARQTPTPMQNNFQTGLGQMGGMNNLFGRAFAGKPV